MDEYTDQEIEMLARFSFDKEIHDSWDVATPEQRKHAKALVVERLRWNSVELRATLRLMREAREQGLASARDEIRKAGEGEQATWDQLVRNVKEARERGATEMLDKALAVTRKIAALALASVKKRDTEKPYTLANAHDEGAYVQAETIVLALEELSASDGPSEYERGAADMRERAALAVRRAYYAGNVNSRTEDDIRDLSLAPTADDAKASKLARLQLQLSDAGDRHDRDECDRLDAEIAAIERIDE